jgi:HKD family nuclease
MLNLVAQPHSVLRLGDILLTSLRDDNLGWHTFNGAVAFVKKSGVAYLSDALQHFHERGGHTIITAGVDLHGTSVEGLKELLAVVGEHGEVWIYHNEAGSTFHPKVFTLNNNQHAVVIIGSGNLTVGGLFVNSEAAIKLDLNLSVDEHREFFQQVESALSSWRDPSSGMAKRLDDNLLQQLLEAGYILPEARTSGASGDPRGIPEQATRTVLFAGVTPRRPPRISRISRAFAEAEVEPSTATGFVMTLQRTDVGTGQITAGTSRRSPEIFIPLAARDHRPDFWNWPGAFTEDQNRPGKFDRFNVRMRLAGVVVNVNMMTWPIKHDFRMRSEALRSSGQVGDILRMERSIQGHDFDFYVEIIPQGTTDYDAYLALCTHPVRNSHKRWGYY